MLLQAADRAADAVDLATSGAGLSDTLGLSADYGVTLRANAATALHRLGKWRSARRILTAAEDARPDEVPAIDLHLCLARLLVDIGDVAAATARLTRARRLMTRTIDPQYVVPLAVIEAELALWQRRPDDARRAALAALRALDGTDDVRLRVLSLWLAARAASDQAHAHPNAHAFVDASRLREPQLAFLGSEEQRSAYSAVSRPLLGSRVRRAGARRRTRRPLSAWSHSPSYECY